MLLGKKCTVLAHKDETKIGRGELLDPGFSAAFKILSMRASHRIIRTCQSKLGSLFLTFCQFTTCSKNNPITIQRSQGGPSVDLCNVDT